jgi:hypothetical protein
LFGSAPPPLSASNTGEHTSPSPIHARMQTHADVHTEGSDYSYLDHAGVD